MKKIIIFSALILGAAFSYAQQNRTGSPVQPAVAPDPAASASPSNLNAPANAQPVPNVVKAERSAPAQKLIVPLPSTYTPPIYPGAETQPAETQRNLIFPAATPAPTQPAQTQPLTPVESTNRLNPSQPKRDAPSRNNVVTQPQP